MIKINILLLFTFVFSQISIADNFTIIGQVNDTQNKPVELGNVIALSIKDSAIIKGDVFMDSNK